MFQFFANYYRKMALDPQGTHQDNQFEILPKNIFKFLQNSQPFIS